MPEHGPDPLISVALCTFNGARHLREQLDSVLLQTYQNLEIVAVDDCSSDATLAILQEYARRDTRLRVVVNAINVGFKRNFEFAIAQCRGEYIAPCDQDDVWLPNKLRELFVAIGTNTMAYCDSELIDADGRLLDRAMSDWWRMQSTKDPVAFVLYNCVSGHAMLFRRELLVSALPVPGGSFHDWWLAAVAASLNGVAYCPKKLVRYRQHGDNVTNILHARRSVPAKRPTGVGLLRVREIESRIAGFAALSGPHRTLLAEFHRLWRAHTAQWFSLRLAFFVIAHRRRIFALSRHSGGAQLHMAIMFVFGVRLKRLLKRKKYSR